jgi:UDP-N-acetylglucosamine diphosphorylase / glucose-1-phosphate thymidylyltransferase / UDP-N-acetylgalactosamine diphosphorylase / glucosamine-1-phosphate N-acetyltransferase / galactosamine-1-phosphate N-acetyltransferase
MIVLFEFIEGFDKKFELLKNHSPWLITSHIKEIISELILTTPAEYKIENNVAVHKRAIIEKGAVIKGPAWISEGCYIAAGAYIREGAYLAGEVSIGPGCEIKSSILMTGSRLAHFNFIGDSILGIDVNFEAGAVIANHYNERPNKNITVNYRSEIINTEVFKFGALVGDHSRIGANAVLSPGTLLPKNSIIGRLQLVEQNPRIQVP